MRLRPLFTARLLAGGLAALLIAGAANALSISYYLDQSNTTSTTDPDGVFPDGTNYLVVTLADNGDDIDVTVTLLDPFTGIKDTNFGIQSFFFNSTNSLTEANIDLTGLPAAWSANVPPPPNPADGFGMFDVQVADTGMARLDPTLSFSIVGIVGDSPMDYVEALAGGDQGAHFFAAHVTGFLDQNSLDPVDGCMIDPEGNATPECNLLTSAWFGGSTFVPEPSTALLLLGGLSGLAVLGRRHH